MIDDDRRQALYALASRAVGPVAAAEVESARAARLVVWGDERWQQRGDRRLLRRLRRPRPRPDRALDPEAAGAYAVNSIVKPSAATHAAVLSLVEELFEIGAQSAAARPFPVSDPDPIGDTA